MPTAACHCLRLPGPHRCLQQECCLRACPGATVVAHAMTLLLVLPAPCAQQFMSYNDAHRRQLTLMRPVLEGSRA